MKCFWIALFLLIVSVNFAFSATISGIVYSAETFEPLKNAIVSVNSKPVQQVVAKDANYSFNLAVGNYEISSKYFENQKIILEDLEQVRVEKEGN